MMTKHIVATAFASLMFVSAASAQTIYPIDRAEILAGTRFDLKVEFAGEVTADKASITINGADAASVFGKAPELIAQEAGQPRSALLLRDVTLSTPGRYTVEAGDGAARRSVSWTVYDTGPRWAKNVILFIGDGLSPAHRVAARLLSKGIQEGRAGGKLAIDDMPQMALVSTAGSDSIITDSANAASAYATGHKAAVNAMGVYADRTPDPLDDPKVETLASVAKRRLGLSIGIVTNTEVEDATPAAVIAHTRRRATYDDIVAQFYAAQPDVLMGGAPLTSCQRARTASARMISIIWRSSATPATRSSLTRPTSTRRARRARENCSACSRPATWTACSTAVS